VGRGIQESHSLPRRSRVAGTHSLAGSRLKALLHHFAAVTSPQGRLPEVHGARVSLTVRPQVFRGVSVLAGPASALERLTGVRAKLFVGSLSEAEAELRAGGLSGGTAEPHLNQLSTSSRNSIAGSRSA